jgi:acetyl/propionyl-CoA carboxylase alpha subunit
VRRATEAFDRLAAALRETEVGGVTTNLPFLRWLVGIRSCAPAASRPRS